MPDLSPRDPPADRTRPGTPRWVVVSGAIAIALAVGFAVLHLAGFHGDHDAGPEHRDHAAGDGRAP